MSTSPYKRLAKAGGQSPAECPDRQVKASGCLPISIESYSDATDPPMMCALGHHHQNIDVAPRVHVTSRSGTEEDDFERVNRIENATHESVQGFGVNLHV